MAGRGKVYRYRTRRGSWLDTLPLLPLVLLGLGLGGGGMMVLRETGLADWLLSPPARTAGATAAVSRSFPVCAGRTRITCVVDGDTFWLDGVKIRIADINTPETSQPQCAAEAALGQRATGRLAQLLSEAPFTLEPADRDEDRYGRKLRIAMRDGQSIGALLVGEGLAHEWRGRMESWC